MSRPLDCAHCGAKINQPPTGKRIYCSKLCQGRAQYLRRHPPVVLRCELCNEQLGDLQRRFCSRRCQGVAYRHQGKPAPVTQIPCGHCGESFDRTENIMREYCAPACQFKAAQKRARERLAALRENDPGRQGRVCLVCGVDISDRRLGTKLCSYECRYSREWVRAGHLRRTFGITLAEYNERLAAQDSKCMICGSTEPQGYGTFHVDHCHKTGQVRGLLCGFCNPGLGMFQDDPELLERAAVYLRQALVPA